MHTFHGVDRVTYIEREKTNKQTKNHSDKILIIITLIHHYFPKNEFTAMYNIKFTDELRVQMYREIII